LQRANGRRPWQALVVRGPRGTPGTSLSTLAWTSAWHQARGAGQIRPSSSAGQIRRSSSSGAASISGSATTSTDGTSTPVLAADSDTAGLGAQLLAGSA